MMKCIVLDLDETLIYSSIDNKLKYDFIMKFDDDQYYVSKRPGLDNFINLCFSLFDFVLVWSAGTDDYVKEIVRNIFKNKRPHIVWSRNTTETYYDKIGDKDLYGLKPLKKLFFTFKELNFRNTIILDDKPCVAAKNRLNWILAESYTGDKGDNFLNRLGNFFKKHINNQLYDLRLLPLFVDKKNILIDE